MQFRDLKTQYLELKEDIDIAIGGVLERTDFISGNDVKELERELATYIGVKHCITCANGTDALSLAMMAWSIGVGDAVFVPDFTFFASGEVVALAGATPVFVDVDRRTFNMDPVKLEKAVQRIENEGKLIPKVIVTVDLFGQSADYCRIKEVARNHGLLILEDSAQGFGGCSHGQKNGSFGDISTTSFFPAKPLGCYGDGGALFLNDDELAKKIRSLCVHGKGDCKYDNIFVGMNSRLDTLQAAILRVKLKAFIDTEFEAVNRVADLYKEKLPSEVVIPFVEKDNISSWAQYTIQLTDSEHRNALKDFLAKHNVPSMIYYPKPMHKQEAFNFYGLCENDLNITTELCNSVLALPMHPYLKEEEIEYISSLVEEFFNA